MPSVKQQLRAAGLKPKRNLGQNFLVNQGILNKIIKAAELDKDSAVLEIGAGLGTLTEELAKAAGQVFTVEIDRDLTKILAASIGKYKNVKICAYDVMSAEFAKMFDKWVAKNKDYKIVANIPYNITSLVIKKFLTHPHQPQNMLLMVQKEVGKRITAQPGDLSLLGVSVQYYAKPKIISRVSKNNFYPKPKVDSVLLNLDLFRSFKKDDFKFSDKQFWQIVKIGFSSKRKTLLNNLSAGLQKEKKDIIKILEQADIKPKARAQELSLPEWVKLVEVCFPE